MGCKQILQTIVRYVVFGSDDLVLPKDWLADGDRMAQYEAFTTRQLQQGSVTKDVAAMRRDAFWEAIAAKRQQPAKVAKFERVQR